jgi:transposase
MLSNGLGRPLRFVLSAGQVSDHHRALNLLEGYSDCRYVLADKGYDSDRLVNWLRQHGQEPVIPPISARHVQRAYDRQRYKQRNLIERLFNRLKHYRRVATRFEKNALNYACVLTLACIRLYLNF